MQGIAVPLGGRHDFIDTANAYRDSSDLRAGEGQASSRMMSATLIAYFVHERIISPASLTHVRDYT